MLRQGEGGGRGIRSDEPGLQSGSVVRQSIVRVRHVRVVCTDAVLTAIPAS